MTLSQKNLVRTLIYYFKTCLILSLSLFVLSLLGLTINTENTFIRSFMCTARSVDSILSDLVMESTDICNCHYAILSLFHALCYGHSLVLTHSSH